MSGRVSWITYAPVKGLGLTFVDEVELEATGVRENRRFYLIDETGRLVNGKLVGMFVQVAATADRDGGALELRFPDGTTVGGRVLPGEAVETSFYGRPVCGRLVPGAFSEALAAFAGRDVRLVRADEPGAGSDRGPGASVSLVSTATLDRLAREAGEEAIDGRRFRMLFGAEGVGEHAEDGWVGSSVAIGEAVVRFEAHVGRCAVTTHDPDTGAPDLDTLRLLARYRSDVASDEPLPVGVWGHVERAGRVRVGDSVQPL